MTFCPPYFDADPFANRKAGAASITSAKRTIPDFFICFSSHKLKIYFRLTTGIEPFFTEAEPENSDAKPFMPTAIINKMPTGIS